MIRTLAGVIVAALLGLSASAQAQIPYGSPGTENSIHYSFTAAATGDVTAYFYAVDAGYDSVIGVGVNGNAPTIFGLPNHASAYGASLIIGSAVAGQALDFQLYIYNTFETFHSNYALNTDGFNHVYATAFAGDSFIPAGTYIGFEDLTGGGDRDYNDHQFVFTNVAAIPEPETYAMLLAGLGLLGFAARRRKLKAAAAT